MRIGELAALVGVSTRTVRHYHRLGLLPEPERLPNGYREYRVRDAVTLARVRRLAELGMSLEEIRGVLADDEGRDLRAVLHELDADLARQERAIAARRARLADLLAETELHADTAVSSDMAAVLRALPGDGSRFATLDREMLAMFDAGAEPGFAHLFRPLVDDPAAVARLRRLYARLDELAGAATTDPRVPALAADLAAAMPDELAAAMAASLDQAETGQWLAMLSDELSPAQGEVFRRLVMIVKERV